MNGMQEPTNASAKPASKVKKVQTTAEFVCLFQWVSGQCLQARNNPFSTVVYLFEGAEGARKAAPKTGIKGPIWDSYAWAEAKAKLREEEGDRAIDSEQSEQESEMEYDDEDAEGSATRDKGEGSSRHPNLPAVAPFRADWGDGERVAVPNGRLNAGGDRKGKNKRQRR
jgi:hypothetical protein